MAGDNKKLATFRLDGIPPAPRGVPQIEVTFDIDANGILNVAAKDKATNKEQKVTITASSMLAKEDVDQMVRDAAEHAEEDRKRRAEIESRNEADALTYQAERLIKDLGDKLSDDDRKRDQRPDRGRPRGPEGDRCGRRRLHQAAAAEVLQRVGTAGLRGRRHPRADGGDRWHRRRDGGRARGRGRSRGKRKARRSRGSTRRSDGPSETRDRAGRPPPRWLRNGLGDGRPALSHIGKLVRASCGGWPLLSRGRSASGRR